MLRYWCSVIVEAHKITFSFLFGTALRLVVDAVLFLSAVAVLHFLGRNTQVLDQIGWLEAVIVSAVAIYLPLTIFNIFRVPYSRTKQHLEELQTYKGDVTDSSKPASFNVGIEIEPIDEVKVDEFEGKEAWQSLGMFEKQEVCRIWVENTQSEPIANCRVVIEGIVPPTNVKAGARLILDNRGEDTDAAALFDLSATEKKFFKFIRLVPAFPENGLVFTVETDQRPTGFAGVFRTSPLVLGHEYEITIAVHGNTARSSRIRVLVKPETNKQIKIQSAD